MALLVLSATCPVLPDAGEGRPLEAALAGEPGSDTAWGLAHRQPSQPDPWFVRVVSDGFLPLPLFSLRALPNDNLVHSRRRERERDRERETETGSVEGGNAPSQVLCSQSCCCCKPAPSPQDLAGESAQPGTCVKGSLPSPLPAGRPLSEGALGPDMGLLEFWAPSWCLPALPVQEG